MTSTSPTASIGRGAALPDRVQATRLRGRAILETVALVGAWTALGLGPVRDPVGYLLVGVPLVAAFQIGVRRRPLGELWIRNGRLVRPSWTAWSACFAVLAALPAWTAWQALAARHWMALGWTTAALAGAAVGSAVLLQRYAPRSRSASDPPRRAGLGAAIGAATIGISLVVVNALPTLGDGPWEPMAMVAMASRSWLLYLPALFVLEEVAFRGCVDSHLWPHSDGARGRGQRRGSAGAAVLSSGLWGLWHVPLFVGKVPWPVLLPYLLVVHLLMGIPLALSWRRSGALVLPAAAHAAIDAVRNALLRPIG